MFTVGVGKRGSYGPFSGRAMYDFIHTTEIDPSYARMKLRVILTDSYIATRLLVHKEDIAWIKSKISQKSTDV